MSKTGCVQKSGEDLPAAHNRPATPNIIRTQFTPKAIIQNPMTIAA